LAVGRWDALQKDGPKLIRVLGKILADRTDYSALVIGGGREVIEPVWRRLPQPIKQRIDLAGIQPHEVVQQHCRESRIMLFTSRYEGFPFAASEALCCGCTVVGAVSLPAMCHIATCGGGTVAVSRSDQDFVDALTVEMEAWDSGWRDPQQMSQRWMGEISLQAVARKLLSLGNVHFEGLK
jgi:glycosyltransferase involved in cell wall biosynthesis